MNNQANRLNAALVAAIHRYDDRVETPFNTSASVHTTPHAAFYAHVFAVPDGIKIDVTTGTETQIAAAWNQALTISAGLPPERQIPLLGHADHATDMSLRWLMQHELNHYAIGHLDLVGGAGITEGIPLGFSAASRDAPKSEPVSTTCSPISDLTDEELALAPLCLELQADHDANEIFLGAYSSENWQLFRYYATCILVVIFVIEREERKHADAGKTHPKAATRLFMLLAYLIELPTIPAIKRAYAEGLEELPAGYLPSDTEMRGYMKTVVEPVFDHTQILAEAVDLPELWDELGGKEAFFTDIGRVLEHGCEHPSTYQTAAAKQWAELKPLNDKLLKMLQPFHKF